MPNTLGDSDLARMFATFGVPVVVGSGGSAVTTDGIKTEVDQDLLRGQATSVGARKVSVRLISSISLPALVLGGAIVVDGESFQVVNFTRSSDGKTLEVDCTKVAH